MDEHAARRSVAAARAAGVDGGGGARRCVMAVAAERVPGALDRDGSGGGTIPLLAGRYQTGQTQAYLCTNMVCDLPTNLPEVLAGQLD